MTDAQIRANIASDPDAESGADGAEREEVCKR